MLTELVKITKYANYFVVEIIYSVGIIQLRLANLIQSSSNKIFHLNQKI